MSDGYELTASGLMRKRRELLRESDELHARLAVIAEDVAIIERTLVIFGQTVDPAETSPRAARLTLFYRGELRSFIHEELAKAPGPLKSRDLAERLMDVQGRNVNDRRLRGELVKRIGKALKQMADAGHIEKVEGKHAADWGWRSARP